MANPSNKAVLVTLLLLGAAASTGAVFLDDVLGSSWSADGVTVRPADGPNGEYASIGEGGTVTVALDEQGVNPQSLTIVRRVFVVSNHGENWTRVWVTHGGASSVTVVDEGSGSSVTEAANSTMLAPGDRLVATLRIDTRANATGASDVLLHELSVHTAPVEAPESQQAPTTVTITTTASTPSLTARSLTVDFGPGIGPVNVTVDPLPTPALVADDPPSAGPPVASLRVANSSGRNDVTVNGTNVDAVVPARTVVTLDATRSLVPTTRDVDTRTRLAAAVDVTVPPSLRNHPATLRFSIPRSRFSDGDPTDARIGHLTPDGWHLLDTRVVERTDSTVVLAARTPGFSTFAVFDSPGVSYRWRLPGGTTNTSPRPRTVFTEPGRHQVSLSVTTARGETDTVRGVVLANDRPAVSIAGPRNVSAGDPVTLHADVEDRYGDTTVTWVFPNGDTATGRTVTRSFDPGRQPVTVHVSDNYGANVTVTETIPVTGSSAGIAASIASRETVSRVLVGVTVVGIVFLAIIIVGLFLFATGRLRVGDPDDDALILAFRGKISLGNGLENDPDATLSGSPQDVLAGEPPTATEIRGAVLAAGDSLANRARRATGAFVARRRGPVSISAPALRRTRAPEVTAFHRPSWDPRRNRFVIGTLAVAHPDRALATVEITITDGAGDPLARKTVNLEGRGEYRSSPEIVPGVPEADVANAGRFEAHVRVADRWSNEATVRQQVAVPLGVSVS